MSIDSDDNDEDDKDDNDEDDEVESGNNGSGGKRKRAARSNNSGPRLMAMDGSAVRSINASAMDVQSVSSVSFNKESIAGPKFRPSNITKMRNGGMLHHMGNIDKSWCGKCCYMVNSIRCNKQTFFLRLLRHLLLPRRHDQSRLL